MSGPSFFCQRIRGNAVNCSIRQLRGGLVSDFLFNNGGTTIAIFSEGIGYRPRKCAIRYKGKIFSASHFIDRQSNDAANGSEAGFSLAPNYGTSYANPSDWVTCNGYIVNFVFGDGGNVNRWVRWDGTTAILTSTGNIGVTTFGTSSLYLYKGLVYAWQSSTQSGFNWVRTYNYLTHATARADVNALVTIKSEDGQFFVLDDRLFLLATMNSGAVPCKLLELSFGSWVDTGLGPLAFRNNGGQVGVIKVGADVFAFCGDSTGSGLHCYKLNVATHGAPLTATQITAPIPSVLQDGSSIGTPAQYRCVGIVDTVSTPGVAKAYVVFLSDASTGAIPTLFEWVDETTEMIAVGTPAVDGSYGYPQITEGGGDFMGGLEPVGGATSPLVTTQPVGSASGTTGVQISFTAHGDGLEVPHGAVTGAFTKGEVATQVPSGATGTIIAVLANSVVLGSASGAWTDGQGFTTTGGSATQNAAATGGSSDKTVTARYYLGAGDTGLGVPITGQCTMAAGSGVNGTVVGNELQGVVADSLTVASFEWDFLTDGVPQALVDHVQLFITRP